jgi:hypothetical protein
MDPQVDVVPQHHGDMQSPRRRSMPGTRFSVFRSATGCDTGNLTESLFSQKVFSLKLRVLWKKWVFGPINLL